jgi:hypothetical protein
MVLLIVIIVIVIIYSLSNNTLKEKRPIRPISIAQATTNINRNQQGNLYDLCPCKNGLICQNGVCKADLNTRCLITSDCANPYICFDGTCVNKPTETLELRTTKYYQQENKGRICVNRNIAELVLNGQNELVLSFLKGWWSLNKVTSICDGDTSGILFCVAESGLYKLTCNSDLFLPRKITVNMKIDQVFQYKNKLHLLTLEGDLYQVVNQRNDKRWKYVHLVELENRKIVNEPIERIYTNGVDKISIKVNNQVYTYNNKKETWTKENKNLIKIVYGLDANLYMYLNRVELIYNNSTFVLNSTVKDLSFIPKSIIEHMALLESFLVTTITGQIQLCTPVIWNKNNYIRTQNCHLNGDYLIQTNNNLWVITGAKCASI